MRPISAVDCVAPAIQRTREFLFRPFSWGTFLKLCLVAVITEGLWSSSNSSSHSAHPSGRFPSGHGPMINSPLDLTSLMVAEIVAASLLALVVSAFVFYLITRLRFAYFHCLVHNTKEIRPGWRLYASQANRFFWLNLAVGICFLLVVALVAIPFVFGFIRLLHDTPHGGHPNFGLLLALALPLIPIIILLVLAGVVTDITLRDWMLPHFALENATAGRAWAQVWARIKAEKMQFFVYLLLRLVLPAIAVVAMFMVLLLPGIFLVWAVAALELGLHSVFADSTGGAAVVGILLQAFFGIIAFVFVVLAGLCLGGPVSTGVREWALVFYGGRYRALGDILYPPLPPPPPPLTRAPEFA
jgi:hypothetical protein